MTESEDTYLRLTWGDIESDIDILADRIKESKIRFDGMIALSRGGLIPARLLSDKLDIRHISTMSIEYYTGINETKKVPRVVNCGISYKPKMCLVVDDIYDTGVSMSLALQTLREYRFKGKIHVATMYCRETAHQTPSYFSRLVREGVWVVFPWEKKEFK